MDCPCELRKRRHGLMARLEGVSLFYPRNRQRPMNNGTREDTGVEERKSEEDDEITAYYIFIIRHAERERARRKNVYMKKKTNRLEGNSRGKKYACGNETRRRVGTIRQRRIFVTSRPPVVRPSGQSAD